MKNQGQPTSQTTGKAKLVIDPKAIQAGLRHLGGHERLTIKVDKTIDGKIRMDYRDSGITVRLNPRRIQTQQQLDEVISYLREDLER